MYALKGRLAAAVDAAAEALQVDKAAWDESRVQRGPDGRFGTIGGVTREAPLHREARRDQLQQHTTEALIAHQTALRGGVPSKTTTRPEVVYDVLAREARLGLVHGAATGVGAVARGAGAPRSSARSAPAPAPAPAPVPTPAARRAEELSAAAERASAKAVAQGTVSAHSAAADAHTEASEAHMEVGNAARAEAHMESSLSHEDAAARLAEAPAPLRIPAAPVASPPRVDPEASARAAFMRTAATAPITDIRLFGDGDNLNVVVPARVGDHAAFLKPGHEPSVDSESFGFDAAAAVARHQAFERTAREIGMASAIQPAVLRTTFNDPGSRAMLGEMRHLVEALHESDMGRAPQVFVTRAAAADTMPAALSPRRASLVSEHDRVGAALMDFLHENEDRHAKNVLVDPRGKLTLIDHDRNGADRTVSVFFPGGGMSYAGRQASRHDLPPTMRALVDRLAHAPLETIKSEYTCNNFDARQLRERAEAVHDHGLDAALVKHRAEFRNLTNAGGGNVRAR